jgi:pyruvate,water dikinase
LGGSQFEEDFNLLVSQFGHLSDNSNNFTAIPWRENSSLIINMIKDYKQIDNEKKNRIGIADLKVQGLREKLILFLYRRARRFTFLREKVSRAYVYGYGLFRPYFLSLGERMSSNGWIPAKEDIFYLSWEEIEEAINNKGSTSLQKEISKRKEEMERYNGVVLPDVIYGDNPPPLLSGSKSRMFGTPTSQGYYSGYVKVIKGLQDFGKVAAGDVIVIPFSDVGWMPLFSLAGAVIAESGGLLSHSSIIAREYQIPAVVSVTNCMLLKDNQFVSVNGYSGEIVVVEENQI